ncbi:unnamed protein product [Nesidiocoris tenuis]|uniref:Uncharacterized protein n=1 Tax=Nesidiocoris tenuis TaxID=355587 RepID=A0A6H5HTI6_9HEMI|nr:unnamed protein product [Nesidiocoris tenuis]
MKLLLTIVLLISLHSAYTQQLELENSEFLDAPSLRFFISSEEINLPDIGGREFGEDGKYFAQTSFRPADIPRKARGSKSFTDILPRFFQLSAFPQTVRNGKKKRAHSTDSSPNCIQSTCAAARVGRLYMTILLAPARIMRKSVGPKEQSDRKTLGTAPDGAKTRGLWIVERFPTSGEAYQKKGINTIPIGHIGLPGQALSQ